MKIMLIMFIVICLAAAAWTYYKNNPDDIIDWQEWIGDAVIVAMVYGFYELSEHVTIS